MANLNKVFLMGNLTRDPELRYTPGGTAVAEFGLASNRKYRTQAGEMQEETTFVDIVVWGRQGENVSQYLSKGRGVFVEGRLQYDSWEGQDGQKRSRIRVVADNVQFLGAPGAGGGGGGGGGGGRPEPRRDQRSSGPPPRAPEPSVQEGPPDDDFNLDDVPF